MPFHEIELRWIRILQQFLRTSFFDSVFLAWDYVDTLFFSVILIFFCWFFIEKRIGIRLFYMFVLSSILNSALKGYFQLPRPCHIDPLVGLLSYKTQGFPSGAAQTASLVAGVIWIESRRKRYRYLGIIFALCMCFSRVYLGVHFFSDILGGILIGSFLLILYSHLFLWIELDFVYLSGSLSRLLVFKPILKKFKTSEVEHPEKSVLSNGQRLVEKKTKPRFILFALLLLCLCKSKFLVQTGVSLGVAIGLLFAKEESFVKRSWYFRVLEALSGLTVFLLFFEVKNVFPKGKFFFSLAGGLCLSMGSFFCNYLCKLWRPANILGGER